MSDFGPSKAKSVIKWISNEDNIDLIKGFIKIGINPSVEKINYQSDSRLLGKRVVITGTIPGATREEIKKIIEAKGATLSSSVSSKTDILFAGEKPSESKVNKIDPSKVIIIKDIKDLNDEKF